MNSRTGSCADPFPGLENGRRCENTECLQDQVYHMRRQVEGEAERQVSLVMLGMLILVADGRWTERGKAKCSLAVTAIWIRDNQGTHLHTGREHKNRG